MNTRCSSRRVTEPLAQAICWLYYVAGSLLYAVGVNMFSEPNQLVPGGVTGVSMLVHHVWPAFPIGLGILLINLPLLLLSWRFLGRAFTVRTACVTVIASAAIDVTAPFVPPYTTDALLAALCGGVLSGAGLSLVFLRGATTGGTEIVARLLERRWPHLSMGRLMLLVDGVIIAVSVPVFGRLEAALYAAVLVFVCSVVLDRLIGGAHSTRTVLIVSSEEEAITTAVTARMERGVTVIPAAGGYTGEERSVLLCAVRPSEVYPLRLLVGSCDSAAFLIVLASEQVLGNGFQQMDPQ